MFLTCPLIDQAITLKFRLLSIQFTSERFVCNRTMSEIRVLQHLSGGEEIRSSYLWADKKRRKIRLLAQEIQHA